MKRNLIGLCVALLTFAIGFAPQMFRSGAQTRTEVTTPVTVESTPQPVVVDDKKQTSEETFVDSWYCPPDRSKFWNGEVYFIYLANVSEDENVKHLSAAVMTNIYDDVDRDFADAIETRIKGDHFYFRTAALKGISYKFNGVFFKGRKVGEENEPILRGTLSRFVKGSKAGSFTGTFRYVEPKCMH